MDASTMSMRFLPPAPPAVAAFFGAAAIASPPTTVRARADGPTAITVAPRNVLRSIAALSRVLRTIFLISFGKGPALDATVRFAPVTTQHHEQHRAPPR